MQDKELAPSVVDYVFAHAQEKPDACAIASDNVSYSYSELAQRVRVLAAALQARGIGRGDTVAALTTPRCDAFTLFLALNAIGAIWVCLNPKYQQREMDHIFRDSKPKALFFISELGGRSYLKAVSALANNAEQPLWLCSMDRRTGEGEPNADFLPELIEGKAPAQLPDRNREDDAAIIYTSGSTGNPKGCLLPNRSIVYRANRQIIDYTLQDVPRLLVPIPLDHVGGLVLMSSYAIVAGGTANFVERFDPADVGRLVAERRINFLMLLPTMYQMVFESPAFDPQDFKDCEIFFWSGACMPVPMIKQLRQLGHGRVRSNWGQTEACSSVTVTDEDLDDETMAVTIGYSPTGEVRVMNDEGEPCKPGEIGMAQVEPTYCMSGYLNLPEATANAYTDDGWLITGDNVEVMADGKNLKFIGRNFDMFKSGGYNVYPAEVEMYIGDMPEVSTVAVVGMKDELFGEVGCAYLTLTPGSTLDEEAMREWCKKHMANYKVPKVFKVLEEMPLLANGKINKNVLRAMLKD